MNIDGEKQKPHIFILAGSYKEARCLARKTGLGPRNWTLLDRPEKLRGLRGGSYIRFGSWFNLKDIREIEHRIAEQEMTEQKEMKSGDYTTKGDQS